MLPRRISASSQADEPRYTKTSLGQSPPLFASPARNGGHSLSNAARLCFMSCHRLGSHLSAVVQVADLPSGRQAQLIVLYGLVLLWCDLNDHGGKVKAARRVRRKPDRHDARGYCILVDLQQLDPRAVWIRSLKTIDGPKASLDLIVGLRISQRPRPATRKLHTRFLKIASTIQLNGPIVGSFALGVTMIRHHYLLTRRERIESGRGHCLGLAEGRSNRNARTQAYSGYSTPRRKKINP